MPRFSVSQIRCLAYWTLAIVKRKRSVNLPRIATLYSSLPLAYQRPFLLYAPSPPTTGDGAPLLEETSKSGKTWRSWGWDWKNIGWLQILSGFFMKKNSAIWCENDANICDLVRMVFSPFFTHHYDVSSLNIRLAILVLQFGFLKIRPKMGKENEW